MYINETSELKTLIAALRNDSVDLVINCINIDQLHAELIEASKDFQRIPTSIFSRYYLLGNYGFQTDIDRSDILIHADCIKAEHTDDCQIFETTFFDSATKTALRLTFQHDSEHTGLLKHSLQSMTKNHTVRTLYGMLRVIHQYFTNDNKEIVV